MGTTRRTPTPISCGAATRPSGTSLRHAAVPPVRVPGTRDLPYSVCMHPSAMKVASVLRELGVAGGVRELPEPAPTAPAAAAQLGCEVGAIANSLVFNADG